MSKIDQKIYQVHSLLNGSVIPHDQEVAPELSAVFPRVLQAPAPCVPGDQLVAPVPPPLPAGVRAAGQGEHLLGVTRRLPGEADVV